MRHRINRSVDLGNGYIEVAAGFSFKTNKDGTVSRIKLNKEITKRIRLSENPKKEIQDLLLLLVSEGVSASMIFITLNNVSYNASAYQIYLKSGDFAVDHNGSDITFPEEAIGHYKS